MTLAVVRKQWFDMQGRVWTYPIFALTVSILSGTEARVQALHGLAALFLALDLASQTAGDDAKHGTHEFIFTRPIDRRSYVSTKFLFCVPILIVFALLCTLFEKLNVREWFFTMVSDPVGIDLAARPVDLLQRALEIGVLLFAFSVMFLFIIVTDQGDTFTTHGFLAVVLVGVFMFVTQAFLLGTVGVAPTIAGNLRVPLYALGSFASCLVPFAGLYWFSREVYARRTLPVPGSTGGKQRNMGWVGLLIVLVVLALLAFYVLAARSAAPIGGQ